MSASTGSLAAGLLAAGAGPGAASGAALGATSRQLNAAVSAVITATRWLPAEELKRNADLYRDCGQLHRRSAQLVVRLRRLLLALATPALGAPTPGTPAPGTGSTQCPAGRSFDIQELELRVDEVVSVSVALTSVKAALSLCASQAAGAGAGGGGGGCTAVLAYKLQWWRGRVWQDRVTLLHLMQAIVTETLAHCSQQPEWPGWRSILRMVAVYNDMLAIGSSREGSVVGVCRNSCPTLQYPLRKLSLTRILQLLAQQRAELCCRQLVNGLLTSYRPAHPSPRTSPPASPRVDSPASSGSSPLPEDDNSSMEIFRALTHHLSPPHKPGTSAGGLTPVASDAACAGRRGAGGGGEAAGGSGGGCGGGTARGVDLERLVRQEDALLGGLLQAAVHHASHLLGAGAVRISKTTGMKRARGGVRRRAQQYYQQLLWGEVGCVVEHVLLWWGTGGYSHGPLGAEPPEQCHHLRAWLIELTKSPAVPALCLGALQSLVDSLGVHVSSTSWDALFRRSIVAAGYQHSRHPAPAEGVEEGGRGDVDAGVRGTSTGRLFTATLADLVDLSNLCEGEGPASAAPPLDEIEALPMVEQIPLLHRLDHSVHTTRLCMAARARQLASSWTLAAFFLVSQRDVANCLAELSRLKV